MFHPPVLVLDSLYWCGWCVQYCAEHSEGQRSRALFSLHTAAPDAHPQWLLGPVKTNLLLSFKHWLSKLFTPLKIRSILSSSNRTAYDKVNNVDVPEMLVHNSNACDEEHTCSNRCRRWPKKRKERKTNLLSHLQHSHSALKSMGFDLTPGNNVLHKRTIKLLFYAAGRTVQMFFV